jgi:hypothetical protein
MKKQKCSCYGGFDCQRCNPSKYMKKLKTPNDWLQEIVKEVGAKEEEIPQGWMTVMDMTQELDMTIGQVEAMLRRAIRAGKIQRKQFRIDTRGAGIKSVWHYTKK